MANTTHTTTNTASAITCLAAQRFAIHEAAERGLRDLGSAEEARLASLNSVIAHCAAQTPDEAALQIELALEHVELAAHGLGTEGGMEDAEAALRSALALLRGASAIEALAA